MWQPVLNWSFSHDSILKYLCCDRFSLSSAIRVVCWAQTVTELMRFLSQTLPVSLKFLLFWMLFTDLELRY